MRAGCGRPASAAASTASMSTRWPLSSAGDLWIEALEPGATARLPRCPHHVRQQPPRSDARPSQPGSRTMPSSGSRGSRLRRVWGRMIRTSVSLRRLSARMVGNRECRFAGTSRGGSDGTRTGDLRRDRPVMARPDGAGIGGDSRREQGLSAVVLRGLPGASGNLRGPWADQRGMHRCPSCKLPGGVRDAVLSSPDRVVNFVREDARPVCRPGI